MEHVKELDEHGVQGVLHQPEGRQADTGVVLTHGAGADCRSALLAALAKQLTAAGFLVLRCNMVFRQRRKTGPPHPSHAVKDREGLRQAVEYLRALGPSRLILGGHSYGGRQATMLAAEDQGVADRLLLFSYPLHPPNKPDQKRTGHFPQLQTDSIFVHGTKDPFGAPEEMTDTLRLIPAQTRLVLVPGAGHDLKRGNFDLLNLIGSLE